MLFPPTVGAAITASHWYLWIRCPACRTTQSVDLRTLTLASYSDKLTLAEHRALTSIPFAHPNLKFMEELLCLLCR